MKALDLFCGAGGVSVGLQRAGFEVTGVDIRPQPRYRGGSFVQADALTFPLDGYDFIWASPPCQAYTCMRSLYREKVRPELIEPVRLRLQESGAIYVIENVPGAPLNDPIRLCGSMFGLQVRRHRLFESNIFMLAPQCRHDLFGEPRFPANCAKRQVEIGRKKALSNVVPVYGGTRKAGDDALRRWAMGIDWMRREELTQAIPPAYSEWIGKQALAHLGHSAPT